MSSQRCPLLDPLTLSLASRTTILYSLALGGQRGRVRKHAIRPDTIRNRRSGEVRRAEVTSQLAKQSKERNLSFSKGGKRAAVGREGMALKGSPPTPAAASLSRDKVKGKNTPTKTTNAPISPAQASFAIRKPFAARCCRARVNKWYL